MMDGLATKQFIQYKKHSCTGTHYHSILAYSNTLSSLLVSVKNTKIEKHRNSFCYQYSIQTHDSAAVNEKENLQSSRKFPLPPPSIHQSRGAELGEREAEPGKQLGKKHLQIKHSKYKVF